MNYQTLKAKEDCEGKVFHTNGFGDVEVLEFRKTTDVVVKFLNTGSVLSVRLGNLLKGRVKDLTAPSLYCVGVLGLGFDKTEGKSKTYRLWADMLKRCYSVKSLKASPTYSQCSVSENFRYYPFFKDWCEKQVGFGDKGWQLDKDIISKGGKVYSEDTCCFVPQEINLLLNKKSSKESSLPIGVVYHKQLKKFKAQCSFYGKNTHLGVFDDFEKAFVTYKVAKEKYVKEVANKWKEQIDTCVYKALMTYQVEITE